MEKILFSGFIDNYIQKLDEEMLSYISNNKYCVKIPSIYNFFVKNLLKISQTMLISEIHELKKSNKLKGNTSQERYEFFNNLISKEKTITYFEKKYPRTMQKNVLLLENTIGYLKEIICNIHNDKNKLFSEFNIKKIHVEDIVMGSGDTHNNGKTVAEIHIDGKLIIYKPHSLANDYLYNNILDFFSNTLNLKLNLKKINTLDCGTYGYQEYIQNCNLKDLKESEDYFYRIGIISGICYVLTTTDLHYENIISQGSMPFLVDLETIFNPINESRNQLYPKQENTILSTCLYPFNESSTYNNKDLSGIFGKISYSEQKVKQEFLMNLFEDEIYIDEKEISIDKTKFDSISMRIEDKNPLEYVKHIKKGMSDFLKEFLLHKKNFLSFLELQVTNELVCRVLKRDTQVYMEFIQASNHISYSSDEKQEILFNIFKKNTTVRDKEVVEDEIEVMKSNNVPYYYTHPYSKDLYSSSGKIFKNYYPKTYYDNLLTHLNNINKQEIQYQLFMLDNSFAKITDPLFHKDNIKLIPYEEVTIDEKLDTMYRKILSGVSINNEEKVDLLTTKFFPEAFIGGVNYSLYEDLGMIWFLYTYSRLKNDEFGKEVSLRLFNNVLTMYKKIRKNDILFSDVSISAFNGVGGLLYITINMFILENKREYLEMINILLNDLEDKIKKTNNLDYLEGVSGIIILLINIIKMEKFDKETIVIINILNLALEKIKNIELDSMDGYGIAHGESGVFLALIYSFSYTKDSEYMIKAENLFKREWFLNKEDKKGWCRGITGIVASLSESIKLISTESILYKQIKSCLEEEMFEFLYENEMNFNGLGLCHGYLGWIETIKNCEFFCNDKYKQRIKRLVEKSSLYVNENTPDISTNYDIPCYGFMLGYSGIAYQLLQQIDSNVPSVLLLKFIN